MESSATESSTIITKLGPKRGKHAREETKTTEAERKTYDDPLLSMFAGFRDEIDDNNDRRERLIKTSRDVTSLSKKLIFLLHRFKPSASPGTDSVLLEAKKKIEEIVELLRTVAAKEGLKPPQNPESFQETVKAEPRTGQKRKCGDGEEVVEDAKNGRFWRYEKNVGPGIEEFIEAVTFYHFLASGKLISHQEIQSLFEETDTAEIQKTGSDLLHQKLALWIPASRYVLGVSDLSGEIMRFATNNAAAQMDGSDVITVCLNFLRTLSHGLNHFVPTVRDMAKKQSVTEQSLRKIEVLASTIKIRSSEFEDQDPEVLKQMIKRALNAEAGHETNE